MAYESGLNYYKQVGQLIGDIGLLTCGFYGGDISYGDCEDMKTMAGNATFVQANPYIEELRARKTPYALLDFIKPGVTEIDIANELEYQFRRRGGSGFCF